MRTSITDRKIGGSVAMAELAYFFFERILALVFKKYKQTAVVLT